MPALSNLQVQIVFKTIRATLPLCLAAVCLWLVHQRLGAPDARAFMAHMIAIDPLRWLGGAAAAWLSFWAVGRYDAVAHRHLRTGVTAPQARRAGVCAIAFSQTLGFGLVTGTFARWRLIPSLAPLMAVRLNIFVSVSFFAALVVLISIVQLVRPLAHSAGWLGLPGLALGLGIVALAFLRPVVRLGRLTLRLPSLPAMASIAMLTLADTLAAALALAILLPPGAGIGFGLLFPAYLVALAVAMISGTPGGVGPFELTLLALLPQGDPTAIMGGIVAYRLIYFALPALLAGLILLHPAPRTMPAPPEQMIPLPQDRPKAEAALIHQNSGRVAGTAQSAVALFDTGQTTVALFGPLRGPVPDMLSLLAQEARQANRVACLYKCPPRIAAKARQAGWRVARIAREAVIDIRTFDPTSRSRRQLRRKLRHAKQAGLRIIPGTAPLAIRQMAAIDRAWQAANGRAKGCTMGRFTPDHVAGQKIWLALSGTQLVGFVTFHASAQEWCLDLMRTRADAPDGTMHLLISTAIEAAGAGRLPRISLAAVPDHALAPRGAKGLAQFKASFAPVWAPLYIAAPNRGALMLATADLARAVHWPESLHKEGDAANAHEDDEQNEFAPRAPP